MSRHFGGSFEKSFILVIVGLEAIGLLLFAIFSFISMQQVAGVMGWMLFVATAVLIILGHMFGIVVLGFIAIIIFSMI